MARSSSPAIGCSTESPALEAAHPKPCAVEVQFVAAKAHGLADAQTMAVGHEQQQGSRTPWRPTLAACSSLVTSAGDSDRPRQDASQVGIGGDAPGNRIKMVSQDAGTGEPVARGETVGI